MNTGLETRFSEMKWRLIAAVAGAASLAACGAATSDAGPRTNADGTPLSEETGEETQTPESPKSETDSEVTPKPPSNAKPSSTAQPSSTTQTSEVPPSQPEPMTPIPEPPSCEFGEPETTCYSRERMEYMARFGFGQIPADPPATDEEVAAAFLGNGCAKKEFVGDYCCVPAASEGTPMDNGECCYMHCAGACCGRPLLIHGVAALAQPEHRNDWLAQPSVARSELDSGESHPITTDTSIAEAWLNDALMEHASIASFSRFALELLAFGAPPELVSAAHEAALDEVKHAKSCFALAQRYGAERVGPGALPLTGLSLCSDLAQTAALAVREGCIGETLAALMAGEQAEHAMDAEAREVLRGISEDEAKHAELAWRFVAWAIHKGGHEVRAAVSAAFEDELARVQFAQSAADEAWSDSQVSRWHGAGRLTGAEMAEVERAAKRDVISPAAARLLQTDYAEKRRAAPPRESTQI